MIPCVPDHWHHPYLGCVAQISVGIDQGQTCPSIRFVSGWVKSMFLMDGSVEWDFGWAGLYWLLILAEERLINEVKSTQCYV
jgi:hypothetical protein